MGMSASQVRLLSMTARIHDIENAAQRIQNQKMLLANQSDEAYEEYLNALQQKNIQAAVFNPASGTFNWEEIGLQGLFDNGYALKVNGFSSHNIFQTASTFWDGITVNTNLANVYMVNPPSGFISDVSPVSTANCVEVHEPVEEINSASNIIVSSAADLIELADLSNDSRINLTGKTIILNNDIDFATTPPLRYEYLFKEVKDLRIEGNGHEISNLNKTLIKKATNCKINNLGFNGCENIYDQNMAILVNEAVNNITISNCYIKNSMIDGGNNYAAGFIGSYKNADPGSDYELRIENSYISDVKILGRPNKGGFIGKQEDGKVVIDNCYYSSSDDSSYLADQGLNIPRAGFIGYTNGDVDIKKSYSTINPDGTFLYTMVANVDSRAHVTIDASATVDGKVENVAPSNDACDISALYEFQVSLKIDGETKTYQIYLQSNNSIAALATALQSELDGEYPNTFTVSTSEGSISLSYDNHNVSNLEIEQKFVTNLNDRLGLKNYSQDTVRTPDWVYCTSVSEVENALGCTTSLDGDSPALLRELIANAMAIICTYTPGEVDSEGNQIYKETSVSVDIHLREMQNDQDMARAEANYEAALRKIDQKDKKYDKELAAIENERKAVTQQMETFKNCIKENIDRTFKVFQG